MGVGVRRSGGSNRTFPLVQAGTTDHRFHCVRANYSKVGAARFLICMFLWNVRVRSGRPSISILTLSQIFTWVRIFVLLLIRATTLHGHLHNNWIIIIAVSAETIAKGPKGLGPSG